MIDAARLGLDPLVSWPLLWGACAAAALIWLVYALLGGRALVSRMLGLALLLLALANPIWISEQREPLKDIVALTLDKSESMRFGRRTETARKAFETIRQKLEADPTIDLRVSETSPGADGTDLYAAAMSALADAPRDRIAGTILVTDGQIHDLPENPADASAIGPVHGLIVGEEGEQDRRIEILNAPNFGIVGSSAAISVLVEDPSATTVDIDISLNGEAVARRRVPTGVPAPVTVTIRQRGPNLLVVEAPPGEHEITIANNRAAASISGVRDRLRVLLVTGEPHSGARVWRDLLKADPSVDLVHFTILRPPNKMDPTPIDELALISFPTRELFVDKLNEFDLVIFDRYKRINVLPMAYFDRVARYVSNGGALLVATGPPYAQPQSIYRTPLAAVLPVRPNGRVVQQTFNVRRTETGMRHTVTSALAGEEHWGPWERYIGGDALSGDVVLETDTGAPILVLDRVEQGRVATLMSDQLWLWARNYKGGGPYSELVRRTAHWLMKEPELEEELLTLTPDGETLTAQLRSLSKTPPALSVRDPDGQTLSAEWRETGPGLFEASVPAPRLGLYSATSGALSSVALNGPANPREYLDVRSTKDKVAPVSARTRGGVFRIGTTGDPKLPDIRRVGKSGAGSGDGWAGLRQREAYAVRSSESRRLLPGFIGALAALALFMFGWRREGR